LNVEQPHPPGLDGLLTALRHAGLPVGVAEVARLREVFALAPRLAGSTSPRLRAVLRAVLVKSVEDRDLFERIFDAWLARADQELSRLDAPRDEVETREAPPVARRPRRLLWRALAPAALVLVSLALGGHFVVPPQEPIRPTPPKKRPTVSTIATPAASPAEIRKRNFTALVPFLTVAVEPVWQGWPPLALGVLALLTAGGLWLALRRRRWFPEPAPEPVKKGPPRVFLTPPQLAGPQLLALREQEALVWGIGQFIAEEPTRRLDLAATVRATAQAGGIPHLRFHLARYPREVWLWIDEAAEDPAIQRLAGEIEAALLASGLPVERALFRGIPDWLVDAAGRSFAPNEVDERRDAALVAILTDGRLLARQHAADDLRVGLDALLRSLSHWPRLAFVDFARGPGEIAGILARHSIERIVPAELAAFLGSDESAQRRAALPAVTGDAAWAAACALAPASVDEARAFELRRRLGLGVSPWALRALRTEAPGPPGRLQWRPPDRARRVNWLREAEAQPAGAIADDSLLGAALIYWEEAYDQELETLDPETPAHQHLTMERALLGLWRDAPDAVRALHPLYRGTLHDAVERHLGALAPLDWGGPELLHLPWQWSERSGTEQAMLQEMHLGGGMPVATLERPGRLWLALGICLGLAAGAFAMAALSWARLPEGPPVVVHGPGKPPDAMEGIEKVSARGWVVTVVTRNRLATQKVAAGSRVAVRWEKQSTPCVSRLPGDVEVWSCGGVANPPRARESISRRVIALATAPGNPDAEALAVDLLDTGSADVVLIGPNWRSASLGFGGRTLSNQEILALPDSAWGKLAQNLRFEGTRTVSQVWPNLRLLAGDPSAPLSGCRTGETIVEDGMVFVHICPGTFTMGSVERDQQAYDDEKPAHQVTLSEYWIGKDEVTNAQYGRQHKKTLPATEVSWFDANTFCTQHGWSLPTEAEWENAARAGTQTAWSFGDDERSLEDFAWFEGNSKRELHPVGIKKANPWGLYDMHGNAWEWVADWYEPYSSKPQTYPTGPATGTYRVLRGGAFNDPPRFLRSAIRFRVVPTNRYWFIGFRCARSPRRQP
jgi:hypothetical protein